MRNLKSHPLLKMINSYVIDSPQPSNISYLWNFGSLLGFCLVIQIITGVTLAMHYNPNIWEAFDSLEHIMRDVNNGWLLRYLHANTASAFFFIVYLHIGRGLYYGSYKAPRTLVWTIGTVIFILMMATAFLGYLFSPKWSKLNLIFLLYAFMENYLFNLISFFLATISIIIFYLDVFKLSDFYYINNFQKMKLVNLYFIVKIAMWNPIHIMDLISNFYPQNNDKNNDFNIHGHIGIIGQDLKAIFILWEWYFNIMGVCSTVVRSLFVSCIPNLQKINVILGAGSMGVLSYLKIFSIKRNSILEENIKNNCYNSFSNLNSNITEVMFGNMQSSPLQELLHNIETTNYICLNLIYILTIQILFKIFFKKGIKLNLYKILDKKINNKLQYYINKVISLNKKISLVYIWIILITLIIGSTISAYACHDLYTNVDSYMLVHNKIKAWK